MRKIYENIVLIIKSKGITRKEFANKLINLKPNVNRISETPTLSTIYGYLNGRINIPVDLIPYIAEALDVTEQELFDTSVKTRKRCFKYFIQNASNDELEHFRYFIETQIKNSIGINYRDAIMNTLTNDEKLIKFVHLLPYAPNDFIDKILHKLEEYERIDKEEF